LTTKTRTAAATTTITTVR